MTTDTTSNKKNGPEEGWSACVLREETCGEEGVDEDDGNETQEKKNTLLENKARTTGTREGGIRARPTRGGGQAPTDRSFFLIRVPGQSGNVGGSESETHCRGFRRETTHLAVCCERVFALLLEVLGIGILSSSDSRLINLYTGMAILEHHSAVCGGLFSILGKLGFGHRLDRERTASGRVSNLTDDVGGRQ